MYIEASVAGAGGSSDLSKPSLRSAIELLRDRAKWPGDFEWDYSSCTKCAMGLFHRVWNSEKPQIDPVATTSALIGVPFESGQRIFGQLHTNRHHSEITPEVVAAELEALDV